VTLLDWYGLKRLAAALVVLVLVVASPAMARAADDGSPAVSSQPATETGGDKPAEEKQEAPQLQIQDEGPPAGSERARQPRIQLTHDEDAVERPYWKNWVFWSVAGAVAVGAVLTLVYMASGHSDVAPCPVDIAASLECHGVGR
jgi:hypothetical protein